MVFRNLCFLEFWTKVAPSSIKVNPSVPGTLFSSPLYLAIIHVQMIWWLAVNFFKKFQETKARILFVQWHFIQDLRFLFLKTVHQFVLSIEDNCFLWYVYFLQATCLKSGTFLPVAKYICCFVANTFQAQSLSLLQIEIFSEWMLRVMRSIKT